MTILNVVQPEEFDPSSFTEIDGKLKVAISGDDDNILEYKEDGLYAKASGTVAVLGRYTYQANEMGVVIHKGIKFSLRNIDGAISGEISGVDINDITEDDVIYNVSDRVAEGSYSDDSKLLLSIPWAVEKSQRFIIRLMRSGVAEMWVVQVATPTHVASLNGFQGITITIDEMANMGDLSSNAEELPQAPPEGDITILGYCRTPMGIRTAIIGRGGNRIGVARIEGGEGDVSIANTRFGTLGVNYLELMTRNPKARIGYCAIVGYLIYHDGDKYNVMIEGDTPVAVNLPNPDYDTGIVGIGMAISKLGEATFVYTMDAQSFSYQESIDTDPLEFSDVTTIGAPTDGVIKDYVVSGSKAHYLLVKNGTYVLHTTDLHTKEVTENVIMVYSDTDGDVKLINGGLGSAFAYIDKTQAQVIVGVVASMNMADFKLNLTPVDPIILDGPLLSIDPLRQISFQMDQTYSIYGMFISPSNMSILRLSTNLMTGGLEKATAPLPQNYLSLLVGGAMTVPFTDTITSIAYDASEDGRRMTFEDLDIGVANGGMYQANSLLRFPAIGKTATLALSPSNTISLFSSDFAGNIDTSVDYIDQEQPYAKTLNGVFVWDQNAHAAAWVSDNKRVYLARFDTTTIVPVITELGESINDHPWLEISHTSNGDVHLSEKLSNTGIAINVWKVDINNTEVVPYFKESIRDETATFEGEHLCGNKLVAFESLVGGSGLRFRAVNVETNESIVSSEVPHFVFANCLFANLTGNTFVVINKLFAEGTWESIGTRVLMVTINETEIIVKDTGVLPLLNAKTLVIGSLSAGVDGDGSNVVNFYADEGGVSYIFRITDLNGEIGLSHQQVTSEMIQGAGIALQDGLPAVVFISSNTAYLQHDFKLSSFKTFPLTMEKYDNSPKPIAFTATWDRNNGHILLKGQIANTYTDNWTYFRLEVDTPSGETHSTKRRTGSAVNGVFTTSLWVIAEPGEYVFRVSHWDGGPVMEVRATVPSDDGLDFTSPTVTPDGDGSWILSTTNAGAAGRGYKIYRSRDPISIIDEYYNGSRYITDVAENDPGRFTIPTSDRNGIWYIMVGQIGTGGIWTPTFFTYGE